MLCFLGSDGRTMGHSCKNDGSVRSEAAMMVVVTVAVVVAENRKGPVEVVEGMWEEKEDRKSEGEGREIGFILDKITPYFLQMDKIALCHIGV